MTYVLLAALLIYCGYVYRHVKAEDSEFTSADVYFTNKSTYENIPSNCHLFGSDLHGEVNNSVMVLNITTDTIFWIDARIGFKRNINPIGVKYSCTDNYQNGITLDDCSESCNKKYFGYKSNHCLCVGHAGIDSIIGTAKPSKTETNGLYVQHPSCIVYEKDVAENNLECDVLKFENNLWVYDTEKCSTKLNFICEENIDNKNITRIWTGANHICRNKNFSLLRQESAVLRNYTHLTQKRFWIQAFRQEIFSWKRDQDSVSPICVVARVNDSGEIVPFTALCSQQFPSLCIRSPIVVGGVEPTQSNQVTWIVVIAVICSLIVIITVVVLVVVNTRSTKMQKINTREENEDLKCNDITMNTTTASCIPNLAATYSDPKNTLAIRHYAGGMQDTHNAEPVYESTGNINVLHNKTNSGSDIYTEPIADYVC